MELYRKGILLLQHPSLKSRFEGNIIIATSIIKLIKFKGSIIIATSIIKLKVRRKYYYCNIYY